MTGLLMKSIFKKIIVSIIFLSLFQAGSADTSEYQLEDLSWLSGHWLDYPKENKIFETIWSPVRGNSMVGTTRVIWQSELAYYEMLTM
jgi:Domain of unknown function (DUF6265)